MKTRLFIAALLFSTFAATALKAQITIDISKITCAQFLNFSIADPDKIAVWLSGYHHGKRGNTIALPQEFKENLAKVKSACHLQENSKLPVMEVVEKIIDLNE